MNTQRLNSKPRARSRDPVRDGHVLAAMAVVVLALGIGLNLQFGLAFWLAAMAALSLYVVLVSTHVLIRRNDALRRDVARLEGQLARPPVHASSTASAMPKPPLAASTAPARVPVVSPSPEANSASDVPAVRAAEPTRSIHTASLADYWTVRPAAHELEAAAAPTPPAADPAAARCATGQANAPDWSGVESAAWASVPASLGRELLSAAVAPVVTPPVAAATAAMPSASLPTVSREGDLEKINVLIKKLAADINAGHGGFYSAAGDDADGGELPGKHEPTAEATVPIQPRSVQSAGAQELEPHPFEQHNLADVEASIEALRAAADVMRAAGQGQRRGQESGHRRTGVGLPSVPDPQVAHSPQQSHLRTFDPKGTLETSDSSVVLGSEISRPASSQHHTSDVAAGSHHLPPPLPTSKNDPRLALIAEALEQERFDVMLEPILGLGDRRAQHFEVLLRLKAEVGSAPAEMVMDRVARGSGLLPLLDAIKVERSARIAWRMEDRGKQGSLFSELNGESLVSDRFLDQFADTYRQGEALSRRLVLSFTQGDLRTFSDLQWATLGDMQDLGFRFCLEDITDLDLDFDALATNGFAFVKLDAAVFLEGLWVANGAAASTMIPPADICRYFSGLGLTIIVGQIDDEQQSADVKACGVVLGQGALFGGPRSVKADVLRKPHAAVA